MLTPGAPAYAIDLADDEARRWAGVIAAEREIAARLAREAAAEFESVPELLRWAFARLYERTGGLYAREIESWAEGLGVSLGTATMLNCAYELSHLDWPSPFGCTAGVRWIEGLGLVHVRTLDWPLAGMGGATRLFRFRNGTREFISVGVPGQVGVLSGMLPGAYSVTINWAPPAAFPSFDWGPSFLVRHALETCDTYPSAVRLLEETPLSTSVFFTVCGVGRDEGCVIERTPTKSAVRGLSGRALVQANHHVAAAFAANNERIREVEEGEEEFSLAGSVRRADLLSAALSDVGSPSSLEGVAAAIDVPSVLNRVTCQQMAFCPALGEVRVWRGGA